MSVQELKSGIEKLAPEDRRQIAAHLVALRHQDLAKYRSALTQKIDETDPQKWLTLEAFDQRIGS